MEKKMKKKNMKIENIVGIFVIMLLASIFVMPVSAQSQGIPIKLELTAEPSTIEVGETATIIVRLLDENDKPVVTEIDVPVILSTNFGSVPLFMIIHAETNLSETQFTSEVSGIAVISAKSKGLISDTTSIAVVPLPTPTPSPSPSPSPTPTLTPTPTLPPGPGDSDGDGYSDIEEMLAGTDWNDPCDPDPENPACLAIKPPTPTPTPTPTATPVPTPAAATPTPTPPVVPPGAIPGFEAVFAIAGLLAVAYLLRRKG